MELHPIQRLRCNIQAEIGYQDILGWDNLCLGLVRKNITDIQTDLFGRFRVQIIRIVVDE